MIKVEGMDDALKLLDPVAHRKAFIRTANTEVTKAFKDTLKDITGKYNINLKKTEGNYEYAFQSKYNGKKINKRQGRIWARAGTAKEASFNISISGIPPNLALFQTTANRAASFTNKKRLKGSNKIAEGSFVKTRVLKASKQKRLGTAFVARMRNGHIGIFRRMSKQTMRGKGNRAAIRELNIRTVMNMFDQDALRKRVADNVNKNFLKSYYHNWNYYANK